MAFIALLHNVALLVSLALAYSLLMEWFSTRGLRFRFISGMVFGLFVIVGMLDSIHLAEGVFFDGRSIILSVAGLFGGPLVAAIAALISASYRIYVGGAGVLMGVLAIISASALGSVHFMLRKKHRWASTPLAYLMLGLAVHSVMLLLSLTLPGPVTMQVLPQILLPMLVLYPMGNLITSMLFHRQEQHIKLVDDLFQSENRFRQIFDESIAIHMIIDPVDGRIIRVNNAAEKFYGYPAETMQKMNIADLNVLPAQTVRENIQRVMRQEKTRFNFSHQLASGELRSVEVYAGPIPTGNRTLIFTIVHDITELQRHQEALQKERMLLRTVIDNLPDTIYAKDLSLRKTLANKAEYRLLNKTENEVLGKTDFDVFPKELAEKFAADDRQVIETGEAIINKEEQILTGDGKYIWILTTKAPLTDTQGRVVGLVGIGRNITERIQTMEALAWAKEEAEAANRSKTEFLANMSHEIRTPMNAILGFTEALYHKIENPDHKKMLHSVAASGKLLLSLLNDILDLSKIEAGHLDIVPQPVDVKALTKDFETLFQDKISGKGLDFQLDIPDDIPPLLELDETRIKQVLFNLIGNAIKFTHKGQVRLALHFTQESNQPYGTLSIVVEDTGIGIPPDQVEKVFLPFYQQSGQSNRQYGGTGLGLPITKRLLERMNGSISVMSNPGHGSRFTVTLPKVPISNVKQVIKEQTIDTSAVRFKKATVLVVDDAPSNVEIMALQLQMAGLDTMEAGSGEQALSMVSHHKPDLIILDILMPGMNGEEVARQLRQDARYKEIPLLAFTALISDTEKIMDSGLFDGMIQKPVGRKELIEALARFLPYEEVTEKYIPRPSASQGSDKEMPGMLPSPLVIPQEASSTFPELVRLLQTQHLAKWKQIKDHLVLFKIEDFAGQLKQAAMNYQFPVLAQYADTLQKQVDALDLEGMKESIAGFPLLLDMMESAAT